MGERRRRDGAGRPVMTRPKSTFTDLNDGVPQRLGADGVWRDDPNAKKAQLELLADGSALYFVVGGERIAYRADGQWMPMRSDITVQDDAPGAGPLQ